MSDEVLNILAVVGSLKKNSVCRVAVQHVSRRLKTAGCQVDVLDLALEPLALYNPDTAHEGPAYSALRSRVEQSDVVILATPDYHGSISSATKNFLDHFWHEFAGKLFATVVASHEKGLTVTDQLRTVARQCYAWTLPYGVSFTEGSDVKDGKIVSDTFRKRLEMFERDVCVYGRLLASQRRADLTGTDPGFLARHRAPG